MIPEMKEHLVIGLGEALWDMLPSGKQMGGAPANFVYHVSQFGLQGVAVSALGQDALGDELMDCFEKVGLQVEMPRVEYPTGTVQVSVDAAGVPSYEIKTGSAWDNIPFTSEIEALARRATVVCFGSLAQRSPVSRATISRFLELLPEDSLKVFDINLRQSFYSKEILAESFDRCDILKINDEELEIVKRMFGLEDLSEEAACRNLMEAYRLGMIILTCGTAGSRVYTPDEVSVMDTPKVTVVDTVGAGDAFTGAFVAALLKECPVRQAHDLAVAVSAYVCTCAGAMPEIPASLTTRI